MNFTTFAIRMRSCVKIMTGFVTKYGSFNKRSMSGDSSTQRDRIGCVLKQSNCTNFSRSQSRSLTGRSFLMNGSSLSSLILAVRRVQERIL